MKHNTRINRVQFASATGIACVILLGCQDAHRSTVPSGSTATSESQHLTPMTLTADGDLHCGEVLIPTLEVSSLQRHQQLAWLSLIDDKTYYSHERNVEVGIKLFLPDLPFPVGADGTFKQFDDRRREYLELKKYNFSQDEKLDMLRSGLEKGAVDAWLKCKLNDFRPENGELLFYPTQYGENLIVVTVKWIPPSGPIRQLPVRAEVPRGATLGSVKLPKYFTTGDTWVLTFTRSSPTSDFYFAVSPPGFPRHLFVRHYLEPPSPKPQTIETTVDPQVEVVVGQTPPDQNGYLELAGLYSPWREGEVPAGKKEWQDVVDDGGVEYFIKSYRDEVVEHQDWRDKAKEHKPPYVVIPPGRKVSVQVRDPKPAGNRNFRGSNRLRAYLHVGQPPGAPGSLTDYQLVVSSSQAVR